MEADAPASVRVPRNTSSSEDSKPSLQALLSDSKQDWLIDEKDLEIAVDENGKAIKLGSGAFGTVRHHSHHYRLAHNAHKYLSILRHYTSPHHMRPPKLHASPSP